MEFLKRLGFLLALGGTVAPVWADRHLFILAGQSNMVGQALRAGQALPDSFPKVRIYDLDGDWMESWLTLRPGLGQDTTRFGLEVTLATTLVDSAPQDTFLLVKAAWSATSLHEDWRSWSPTGTSGPLYTKMLDGVRRAVDALDGPPPSIDGFFWMQGESDAMYEAFAEAYHANFEAFIGDLRRDLRDSTLPIIVGLIDKQPIWAWASQVREAQILSCDAHRYMGKVETGGLETDGVHYTASGLKELGRRMAAVWLEVDRKRPRPIPTGTVRRGSAADPWRMSDGSKPVRFRLVAIDGRKGSWKSAEAWEDEHRRGPRDPVLGFVQWVGESGLVEIRRMAPRP